MVCKQRGTVAFNNGIKQGKQRRDCVQIKIHLLARVEQLITFPHDMTVVLECLQLLRDSCSIGILDVSHLILNILERPQFFADYVEFVVAW